ncbi:acyltransferase family protein [Sphingobacterium mizutaii]|uniref:acyltransferase family protein n=1 Tax=Sphingobacterium mizutaii TaxID=1010 RepID=UPI001627CB74|nr:acyltransferase family protein [Sphingobacterium mizutaii]
MNFRNDIQGLRAIAVLFVLIFHLSDSYLPGGFIGVDIFFVISGYLISKVVKSKIQKGNFVLWDFYFGRIKRIIPAYYFMLIICWILFLFVYAPSDIGKFKLGHFWTFLFNSNNHFAKADDYFGASSNENPFLHTWTLSVEMQFYLFLPILLLMIRNIKMLLIVLTAATLCLIGYSTYEIYIGNKSLMYFSLLSRSSEFFFGVIAAISNIENKKITKNNSLILSFLGLLLVIVSAIIFNESSLFPGIAAVLPCLGTVLILIAYNNKLNQYISNKYFVYLGEISYSVYLWHWPIMAFYRYYTQRYEFTITESFVLLTLTFVASILSYYLIEKPFRSLKGMKFYLPFGGLITANVLMVYFISPAKLKMSNIPAEYIYPQIGVKSHSSDFKNVEVFGKKNAKSKRILFLGDSHALTLKPFLDTIGKKNNFEFRTITNNVYPTIPFIETLQVENEGRRKIIWKLKPIIEKEFKNSQIIILSFYSKEGERWIKPLKLLTENLGQKKLIILSDYPSLDKNPVRVNKDFIKNVNNHNKYKKEFNPMPTSILNIIKGHENIKYVDFSINNDFFNDSPFYHDTLMYYDKSHLNKFGAIKYAEINEKIFMQEFSDLIR